MAEPTQTYSRRPLPESPVARLTSLFKFAEIYGSLSIFKLIPILTNSFFNCDCDRIQRTNAQIPIFVIAIVNNAINQWFLLKNCYL